jgi:hypothetical protein
MITQTLDEPAKGIHGKRSQHECLRGTFEICDILEEADMKIFNATLKNAASVHRFLLALPPFAIGSTMLIARKIIF